MTETGKTLLSWVGGIPQWQSTNSICREPCIRFPAQKNKNKNTTNKRTTIEKKKKGIRK
jgi:hypothetical protein